MLLIVILSLRGTWTTKILIIPNHVLVTNRLFKMIRHPNYFLNIVPEMIGILLVSQSWLTFIVLFPILASILVYRIVHEEKAMRSKFKDY
jgi:isoprenylcysteine carboxyl methyltransferase (ICMT) family protein YpbQ